MKKLLASILTFTIGITAFDLLKSKQVPTPKIYASKQKAVEVSDIQTETIPTKNAPTEKVKNLKPFFDSFGKENFDDGGSYQGYGGWFIADDFRGMPEVWTILLTRSDENSKDGELVWSAMILTEDAEGNSNDEDNFQSIRIKTEKNRLSFITNKIRGIEYKFDGKFFKNGKDFYDDEKVLKGTLRKIIKGKERARFSAEFAYREPRCFH